MTTSKPPVYDPDKLRKEIQTVADDCDRRYGTNILATLIGDTRLSDVPDHELEPLLDRVYDEVKRHDAVDRAKDGG